MLGLLSHLSEAKFVTKDMISQLLLASYASSLGSKTFRELITLEDLTFLKSTLRDKFYADKGMLTGSIGVESQSPDVDTYFSRPLLDKELQQAAANVIKYSDLFSIPIGDKIQICVAGGAVRTILTDVSGIKDLDVFFLVPPRMPLSERKPLVLETIKKMCDFYLKKGKVDKDFEVRAIVQGKYVTTIVFESQLPIQLIHRAYEAVEGDMTDPRNVIHGFDIYASQLAYTADSSKNLSQRVVMTPQAAFSYLTNILIVDIGRMSPSFVHRILKYGQGSRCALPTLMGECRKYEKLDKIEFNGNSYMSKDEPKEFPGYDTTSLGYTGSFIFRLSAVTLDKPERFNRVVYVSPRVLKSINRDRYPDDFTTVCELAIPNKHYAIKRLLKDPVIGEIARSVGMYNRWYSPATKIPQIRRLVVEQFQESYLTMQRNFKPEVLVSNVSRQYTCSIVPLKCSAFSWYGERIKNSVVHITGLSDLCYMACISFMTQGNAITIAGAKEKQIYIIKDVLNMLALDMIVVISRNWRFMNENVISWYFDGHRRQRMAELEALKCVAPARVRE